MAKTREMKTLNFTNLIQISIEEPYPVSWPKPRKLFLIYKIRYFYVLIWEKLNCKTTKMKSLNFTNLIQISIEELYPVSLSKPRNLFLIYKIRYFYVLIWEKLNCKTTKMKSLNFTNLIQISIEEPYPVSWSNPRNLFLIYKKSGTFTFWCGRN